MNKITKLRIHGDNILECESALQLLASALNSDDLALKSGSAYAPIYGLQSDNGEIFEIQLFAGYGRWDFLLTEYVNSLGGLIRETPDAFITRVENISGKNYEKILLALEFSSALPAGNNAWQRTGRALALAYAKIPYLYFAELGGQELDASRAIKATRFPNPLIPFAYVVLGDNSGSMSLPIYVPSPSSHKSIIEIFNGCFGTNEAVQLTRGILLLEDTEKSRDSIEKKVFKILKILSEQRKRNDTLKAEEWADLFAQKSGTEKAQWLINKTMPWNKKTGIKTLTSTFKKLLSATKSIGSVAIGAKEMPICLIPSKKRKTFAKKVALIYKDRVSEDFLNWLGTDACPLICVWIAGFKPRGDDSRPDRGLVPLARMIFGVEDIDLLAVVYGPAKMTMWEQLTQDMHKLAATNGLWEAIVKLSDGILIDSSTSKKLPYIGFLVRKKESDIKEALLPLASDCPSFGEHDIDSVLHLIFSQPTSKDKVYECMCNPPGGDWSGINVFDSSNKVELRWTSLPRVSGTTSKRPDHLVQLLREKTLLSIESKDTATRLESAIGPRLVQYAETLLNSVPVAIKHKEENTWRQYRGAKIETMNFVSGGAFRFISKDNLKATLIRSQIDIAFGIEFKADEKLTIIHILSNDRGRKYIGTIQKIATEIGKFVEVQIISN